MKIKLLSNKVLCMEELKTPTDITNVQEKRILT